MAEKGIVQQFRSFGYDVPKSQKDIRELIIRSQKEGHKFRHDAPPQKIHVLDKRDDAGNDVGGGTGIGNVPGYLDTHGTIMTDTCYDDCIPDLVTKGFLCDSHGAAYDYSYANSSVIGYFNSAEGGSDGLKIEWTFHSAQANPKAQENRFQLLEREQAGKTCGMSIGFMFGNPITGARGWTFSPDEIQPEGIDYIVITPQHYDTEILKWSKPQYASQNLARAQGMWCVIILLRCWVFEVSTTLIPSNEASDVQQTRDSRGRFIPKVSTDIRARLERLSLTALSQITDIFTMAQTQIRAGAKLSKESYDALSGHLDKMDEHLDSMQDHHEDGLKRVKDAKRDARDARKALDAMRKRDDDDDKRDEDDDDDKKDKRTAIDSIINKLEGLK